MLLVPRGMPVFVPMFGSVPHVPSACLKVKPGKWCPICGKGPKNGSSLVCMGCHRVARDRVSQCQGHDRGERQPEPPPIARFKPKTKSPKSTKKPKLNADDVRELLQAAAEAGTVSETRAWLVKAGVSLLDQAMALNPESANSVGVCL